MNRPENVNIQVSQLAVDTFKSQQHDQLDDDKLFYGHLKKCRCCFMQLTEIREPNIIHQWHRETFMAMTGLELSFGRHHSNYLCLNCIEMLKIFTELKVAADGMKKVQNRYIEHHRQQRFEVITVKQEVEDENVALTQVNDTNNQTEDENIIEKIKLEEINHDEVATDEIEVPAKMIDELTECSVQLERLDPTIIAQYSSSKRATKTDADTTTFLIDHTYSLTAAMKVSSCNLCGFETKIKEILVHHIELRHKNPDKQAENELKCPIDGFNKVCKSKNSLKQHRCNFHNRDSQEEKKCNQCGKVFKNKKALRQHQQIHNKNFTCAICVRSFAHKTQLIDHMETYHNDSEFKCTKCSKILKSQFKLKVHQRFSHDEKKFKCDQCNAAFVVPGLLVDHVQVKHEGKRFHCSHPGCSGKFTMRRNTLTHLRVVHKLKDDELKICCKNIKIF